MRVTVYTKPGCHLCEDLLDLLDRMAPQYNLQVTEVNILDDMALYDAFHEEIPVLDIEDGRLGRLKAPIDEPSLRTAFEVARRGLSTGGRSVVTTPKPDPLVDRIARYIGRHWLMLVSIVLGIFVGLPWLAPIFAALGWWNVANPIYTAYALTCHQLPERAGTVFGYQVAFCYRNTALYGGTFFFGLLYAAALSDKWPRLRWMKTPIPWWGAALLVLPMAVDGMTHLLGLRDNMANMVADPSFGAFYIGSQPFSLNWWLRIITGLLAALGVVWFAYPRMERAVEDAENMRMIYSAGALPRVAPTQTY
ncbi:MAG: DUF2085 domain-containing protein [Chloroflexia bacterium]